MSRIPHDIVNEMCQLFCSDIPCTVGYVHSNTCEHDKAKCTGTLFINLNVNAQQR